MSKFSKPGKKVVVKPGGTRWPTFWSYSRFHDFEMCPLAYHAKHILKMGGGTNAAMERGIKIHKKGELYLKGGINGVPQEFSNFKDEMKALKKLDAEAEKSYTISKHYVPCDATDWNNAWLRFKADAGTVDDEADVFTGIDFKTGKKYGSHKDQAEIGVLAIEPHLKSVTVFDIEFWYLDQGLTEEFTFPKSVIPALRKKWGERAKKMLAMRKFKATPSQDACRFCPLRSDKGGTCDAWKKA